jgi:D-proline reductase (dithiol) PrdB
VCHQTVGLVARVIEGAGIATLTMSVAHDVTEHVRPPRAAFVNFPMGNTVGRPGHAEEQRCIVRAAFAALDRMHEPDVVDLGFELDEVDEEGRPWQDTVYTRDYRRRYMKKRDGSRYGESE